MKVTLSRWQVINGVVLHKGIEHEVSASVAAELKRRGVVIGPEPKPAEPATAPKNESKPAAAHKRAKTAAPETPTPTASSDNASSDSAA